jgi:hypothetical protein
MRAEVETVAITDATDRLQLVRLAEDDLKAAARAQTVSYTEGEPSIRVSLA